MTIDKQAGRSMLKKKTLFKRIVNTNDNLMKLRQIAKHCNDLGGGGANLGAGHKFGGGKLGGRTQIWGGGNCPATDYH